MKKRNLNIKFIYKKHRYPRIICLEEGYEVQEVIIPEISGDYFLASITSLGKYKLIDTVPKQEVKIIL